MTQVIGIVGVAGSGKIIVADHLRNRWNYDRVRFADCMKDTLIRGMKIDGTVLVKPTSAAPHPSLDPDHPLQLLRHHWGSRLVHPTLSAAAWACHVDALDYSALLVADDIRYAQEAAAVKWAGGVIWRVVRPGLVVTDTYTEQTQNSIEEDVLINNATTIEALLASVDMLMAQQKEVANV